MDKKDKEKLKIKKDKKKMTVKVETFKRPEAN